MKQYLALTQGSHAPGIAKSEIGGNVYFELKIQFMRELREDTFSENKNDDAYEHLELALDIKINIFYNGLGTMNHQLLDSQGPILGVTPAQALTTIETMLTTPKSGFSNNEKQDTNNSRMAKALTALEAILKIKKKNLKKKNKV
uniref:Uncharacterized protein n=1 Tax=Tanacetum cinerariifolium TaxID=118510 RepID=A0A699GV13_TANCI|nr:hypothetical protein [Tanacetum cinerariifolium]GEW37502.1 hypothetical protein [Tanacetum cinerariifolium]